MQDKNNKVIIDQHGKVMSDTPKNRLKDIVSKNLWNILGSGLAGAIAFAGMVQIIFEKSYVISCADFYGIDKRYFNGTGVVEDKAVYIVCAILLMVFPIFLAYLNRKVKSKIYVILTFLATVLILFMQSLIYTESFLDYIPYKWLQGAINSYITITILLISDIVIAYFIIIRTYFQKNKKYGKIENVIVVIAMLIYISNIITGISIKMNYQASDKKDYEIIGMNQAIVSVYDDKFVVMNCNIQDEEMILEKGKYQLEQMTGVPIVYKEFTKVICK